MNDKWAWLRRLVCRMVGHKWYPISDHGNHKCARCLEIRWIPPEKRYKP